MGTQEKPVMDVKFEGITFRDSGYTCACILKMVDLC